MQKLIKFIWIGLLCAVSAMASTVVEDSKNRFVLEDDVLEVLEHPCMNLDGEIIPGFRFVPENSGYEDGNDVPYRLYRLALPSSEVPSVSISDVKTKVLQKPACKEASFKFSGINVSRPFFKDGLWMVDVKVPMLEKHGSTVALRTGFKLRAEFATAAAGVNPGKRALSRVVNPKAAARFGVKRDAARKALRRAAASELSNVNFLSQIIVGDNEIATMAEDGLYAISFDDIRTSLLPFNRQGDLYGIAVNKLRVYGASPDTLGAVVPGADKRSPNQLFQVPIEVHDHSGNSSAPNGIFDDGDTLFFVGYGNGFWKRMDSEDSSYVNGKMDYFYSHSPYSFYQYFLFGWSETGSALRMDKKLKAPAGAAKKVDWMRYARVEKDNLLRDAYYGKDLDWESATGKEWFWLWHSRFDTTAVTDPELSMPHVKNLNGMVDGGKSYLAVSYFPYRSVRTSRAEKDNDQETQISGVEPMYLSGQQQSVRMNGIRFSFDLNGKSWHSNESTLVPGQNFMFENVNFKKSGNTYALTMLPNSVQYDRFDGYTLAYQWIPVIDSSEWLLPGAASGVIEIPVGTNYSDLNVIKFVNLEPVGLLNVSNGVAKDSVSKKDDVRYLAYRSSKLRKPKRIEGIPRRMESALADLSKVNSKTEYLIIAPEEFMDAALSLGEFRSEGKTITNYATTVVSVEDIYRMYTGGSLSPTAIRNFIAYAYTLCPDLKYVLLAGSGHFDYRGFNPKLAKNYMPPFELEDASVEDFFAALDSGEFVRYGSYDLDVAVGRLPVSTPYEFANYLQKARDYDEMGKYDPGAWRSNVLFTADDAVNGGSPDITRHTLFQEDIADALDSLFLKLNYRWNIKKIYLLTYSEDAAGQKKEAASDFIDALNQGALITTYFGHGSKTDWAGEGLLKPSYISRLNNKGRYTILNSFSCTVGRFDEGNGRSLSEEFLIADGVGSIASIGATRETFAGENKFLGSSFMTEALQKSGAAIGDVFINVKNISSLSLSRQRLNNELYVLIGEPVVQMPVANRKLSIDQNLDTIKGLDNMKISGHVDGIDNGFVNLSLREGRAKRRIALQVEEDSVDVSFNGTLIYSEEIPVKGGRFETNFVTPSKLNYGDSSAEFTAWAYSSGLKGVGRYTKLGINIAGVSNYADSLHDTIPPIIHIQTCYSGGQATDIAHKQKIKLQSPACLQVVVEDSTALDYREQADEGVSVEVVGIEDPYHPFPYIEQNSKRVVFRKTFATEAYPDGDYVFRVRAMDVVGNMSVKDVLVNITGELKDGLTDVFNVPNPVGKKGTTFYFKNLAIDRASTVNIFIYNQNGKLVKVIKNAESGVTHWDGRDNHGRKLANGLYHYVVRSEVAAAGNSKKKTFTKKQKLLISR